MIPYWYFPVFWIAGQPISSFLTLFAIGILVGHFGLIARAKRIGLPAEKTAVFSAALIITGMLGAMFFRSVYSPEMRAALWADPTAILRMYPGFASFGGILGGLLGGGIALWAMRIPARERLRYLDALVYVFPLAFVFGRLGCSLNHDHPGVRTASWLGVRYPDAVRYDLGVLEFLFLWLLIAVQVFLARRLKRPGALFAFFTVCYGVFRLGLDRLHIDPPRFYGVTVDQWASVALLAAGIYIWRRGMAYTDSTNE